MILTKKKRIKEIQYKILSLLDNLPPEKRTVAFISIKLNSSENTIRRHILSLEAEEIIKIGVAADKKRHFFLKDQYRKKIFDCFECECEA